MERKEQDLLLNLAGNSGSSIQDLMKSGLNVFNTSLEEKKTYEGADSINKNPQFQNEKGEFDPTILDNSYRSAVLAYNYMAEDQLNKYIMDSARYSSQNIFAPIKQRDYSQGFTYHKLQNPDRITRGLNGIGRNGIPEFSASELAQNEQVVDFKTGKKLDKPNGNWFKYFADTLVLAQYEKDVDINGIEEGNPGFDKDNIEHKAGEYKLNENGTYYYETLGGRDVTGRKVLWKGDTLTTDGSWANRHLDFFDSDDIDQNSGAKTIMKNLALVGSMFIPGVGEYVALTSAAIQTAGLFGTIGRTLTGDSSEFARNLEGWGQSMNRQMGRTEASSSDPWSGESFINLIADVAAQLKEQRAIFKNLPKLFTGGKGVNEEYLKELEAKYLKELTAANKFPKVEEGSQSWQKIIMAQQELQLANQQKAAKMVQEYTKKFYDLGGDISKLYMTGITVQNAYGEAIKQGANPMDAFLYTLGYAAAEWKLLNTGVGEWILPELRMQRLEHQQIIKTVFSDLLNASKGVSTAVATASKNEKSAIIRKIMNLGKQVAHTDYSVSKGILSNAAANALGEGVEEVSEELLADLAKQAYNTVKWMTGSTSRLDAWQDMGNRYLLSFVGGAIGGGLAGVGLDNLRYANSLKNMTTQQATEKLVAISRDPDQREAFLKNLEKLDLGVSHLSATQYETDDEGKFIGWKPGTTEDNQDKFAKDIIKAQLTFIDNILDAQGGKLDDDSVLKEVIKDVRLGQLLHTNAGNRIIARYNNIMSRIVTASQKLQIVNSPANELANGDGDQKGEESQITKNQRKQAEDELKELIKEKEDLLSGKYSAELALESLIELNPYVMDKLGGMSAIRYAETKAGMSYDQISDKLKDKYLSDYKNIAETNGKDTVALLTDQYLKLSNLTLPALQQMYDSLQGNLADVQKISSLATGIVSYLNSLNAELQENGSQAFLETVQEGVSDLSVQEKGILTLLDGLYTQEDLDNLQALREAYNQAATPEEQQQTRLANNKYILKLAYDKIIPLIEQVVNRGFINSVVRQNLINSLTLLQRAYPQYQDDTTSLSSINNLISKLSNVEQVKHTPIEEVLDKFILDANVSDVRFTGLLNQLSTFYNDVSKDVTEFLPSNGLLERVGEAITLLDLFEGIIYGARTDKLGIDLIQDSGTREYKYNPNYFGINNIVKELAEKYGADDIYKALPTIEGTLADQVVQDLSILKKQLVFYYDLLAINSGQKLSKQKRVETNLNYLLYRHIKNFILTIPDDWKEKDKLQGVLDSMVFTEAHYNSDNKSLSTEDSITLEQEKLNMFQGIHDFFKANQDKINNQEELAKLLNPENLSLLDSQKETLTEHTKQMDGHILVSLLAALSAIDPTAFYANYKDQIKDDIAPIPGQELSILHAVAMALNGEEISKFIRATKQAFYNAIVLEEDDNKRKEFIKAINEDAEAFDTETLRSYIMNEWVVPQFENIMLIEGIPGAGKTDAVLQIVKAMLSSNAEIASKVLSEAWFVHTSEDTAKNLNRTAQLENATYFGHKKLIEHISDWDNNVEGCFRDEFGLVQPKQSLKHLDKLPSIIFIDEVSKYTTLELRIIDQFAKAHGISVITLGDFDQSPAKASYTIPEAIPGVGSGFAYNLKLNRTSFYGTFKLGDSFRVTNVQKEKNLGLLQATIQTDNNDLALHFHYNKEKGLFGDYVITSENFEDPEGGNPLNEGVPNVKEVIDTMVATLNENEKIGFIYYDEDSPIAQLLLSPEYADKIVAYPKNVAQGAEAQYFIVDFNDNFEDLDFNDFYTAITRAKQGSLCFSRTGILNYGDRQISLLPAIHDDITYDSSLPAKSIEEFGKMRKARLEKIFEGKTPGELVYIPREKHTEGVTEVKKPDSSALPEVAALETEEINVETPLLTGTEFAVPKQVEDSKKEATIKDNHKDTEPEVSVEEDIVKIDLALYTHASSELGLNDWNDDGTPIWDNLPPGVREARLDSYFGLEKLFPNLTKAEALQKLAVLHARLLNIRDKSVMESNIGDYLGIDDCYITFAIKNCSNPTRGDWNLYSGYEKFAKSKKEELTDIFVEDERAHLANRRQFIAIIGSGDTDVLEVPLSTLASPITIINTTDSNGNYLLPEVKTVYQAAVDASGNNPYEGIKAVIDKFETEPKYADLIYLCKLWINTGNVIAYQKDATWTPAKNLVDEGGQTDQLKGLNQTRMEILQYNKDTEKPNSIKEIASSPAFITSKIIVPRKSLNSEGKFDVKAGQPIVLWSAHTLLSQNELEDEFLKGNPEVNFAYVNIPSYTVTEYLCSLHNLVTKNGLPVGNIFTAYQIMQRLAFDDAGNLNKDFENYIKELNPISGQDIYDTLISQLQELREIKPDESILDANKRHTEYNKRLKTKLLSVSDKFSGKSWAKSGGSIASQFQNIFIKLTETKIRTSGNTIIIEDNVRKIDTMAGDYRVFDEVKLSRDDPNNSAFIEIVTDPGDNYSLNGKEFTISSKPTPKAFLSPRDSEGNMMDWIRDIVKEGGGTFYTRNGNRHSKDNNKYLANNSKLEPEVPPTIEETLISNINKVLEQEGIDTLNLEQISGNQLGNTLKESILIEGAIAINDYSEDKIAIPIQDDLLIIQINDKFTDDILTLEGPGLKPDGTYEVILAKPSLVGAEEVYKILYNPATGDIEVSEFVEEVNTTEFDLDAIKTVLTDNIPIRSAFTSIRQNKGTQILDTIINATNMAELSLKLQLANPVVLNAIKQRLQNIQDPEAQSIVKMLEGQVVEEQNCTITGKQINISNYKKLSQYT